LCKIYGSAEYLEKAMRDWSDDVFFLELWTELQVRVKAKTSVAGGLTAAQVASQTSTTLGAEDAVETGALFDETASSYQKLRVRCEGYITELLNNNIRNTLSAYTRINPWATLHQTGTNSTQTLPPTAELDALLSMLSSHLAFLSKTLGKVPLRKITRSATQVIDATLFDRVLLQRSFSLAGSVQFSSDISAILSITDKYVGGGVGDVGLRRVREGATLVGLPIRGSKGAREEEEEDSDGKRALGLWEVEKRMFEASGDEAAGCLAELGFERLSVAEGRKVLARRVELSS
jgi:hypothetical protein